MSIVIRDLEFAYFEEGRATLQALQAEFSAQEVTLLTGRSGCGKSTLLYLITGLYPHNAGVLRSGGITVEGACLAGGEEASRVTDPAERSSLVGMLFQNPDLQFCMDTVRNELIFCLENVRTEPEQFEERMREALAFCGLEGYENRVLHTLSGGEKQRVALACVYALRPKWLLLDEPFANIDDASSAEILERLIKLHRECGVGILAVEHRLDRWAGVADRLYIMENGALQMPALMGKNPDAAQLEAAGIQPPGSPYPPIVPRIPADDRTETASSQSREDGKEIILRLENLGLSYTAEADAAGETRSRRQHRQQVVVLEQISAAFRRGHIYAIVGASGSGKSSLFGALSGLFPYTGHAWLNGMELQKSRRALTGKIGFVTQSPQDQFIGGTVRDEVMAAFRKQPDAEQRAEQILRSIRLWKYRDISPYMLSQGQQRRLGVAALMAYDCEVLVCDEPTYAQDHDNTLAIMESLCRQAREKQIALIFSTHDRQVAEACADEIWELRERRLYAADQSFL